jgi:HEAT repeat protein
VDVEETQSFADGTPAVFRTPLEIEIQGDGAARIERVELDRRQKTFEFECAERPRWVRVDPHGWIVKRLREQRPVGEWLEIAAGCEDVNGRRDAVGAIARASKTAKEERESRFCFEALLQRLRDDKSAAVRSLAARALATVGPALAAEASRALIDIAGSDSSAAVRVAALDSLGSFGANAEHVARAKALFDEGYSWATMLAAARAVAALEPDGALSYLESKLALESPHDVLRAGVLARIAQVQDPRAVEVLTAWAFDDARSPEARDAAVRGLGVRGRGNADVRRELAKLLETREYRLRSAVIDSLGALRDPAVLPALTAYYPRCADSRQRRAIEGVLRADWAARQ